jgi:acetyl-CoA C-acetyltransferase
MREVFVIGVGQVPVNNAPDAHVAPLGAQAVQLALADAAVPTDLVAALYVGNMLSGILGQQKQLGSLIVDYAGLGGIEGVAIDAACAAGGAALRLGYQHVASGMADVVVICGAEVMANAPNATVTRALATATDWQLEGSRGESFVSLNATLMRAYMERHGVGADAFAPFAINAHRNALANPNALLRKDVDVQRYLESRMVAAPLRLFDISPICNGAAAVVLASAQIAKSAERAQRPRIQIVASAAFTDSPALSRRSDPLRLMAVENSTRAALKQAGIGHEAVDFFELHDAYTIMSVLSLEAAGFARPGTGTRLGLEQHIKVGGELPISTMGGLKARGHPVGATGVYQMVESYSQLAGTAGTNQLREPEHALLQNVGGIASTVVTHVMRRVA